MEQIELEMSNNKNEKQQIPLTIIYAFKKETNKKDHTNANKNSHNNPTNITPPKNQHQQHQHNQKLHHLRCSQNNNAKQQ